MGSSHLKRELAGVALLLFATFLAASIALGWGGLVVPSCSQARGLVGPVGSWLCLLSTGAVGMPAAVLIPLIPAVHALRLFGRMESRTDRSWLVFLIGIALWLPVAIALALSVGRDRRPTTGVWGAMVAYYLDKAFGFAGGWIVLILAISALMVVTLAWNPMRLIVGSRRPQLVPADALQDVAESAAPRRPRKRKPGDELTSAELLAPTPEEMPAVEPSLLREEAAGAIDDAASMREGKRGGKRSKADLAHQREDKIAADIAARDLPDVADDELPRADLLTPAAPRNPDFGKRELDAMGLKLKEALRTFRVEAEIVGRTTGPVVTQFEVEPAAGVKVRQIANLSNDLALAMRAQSIRIVAPIPGRGAVGVEVPNPTAEIVAFRELIDSSEFKGARAALPFALGKDLEGKPVIADLAKMPHLLIAGATGSGKSVCINTLITSLVYRHTPRTLRFLMVDPKMVELSVYNQIPHLRHKVITDNRDAAAVLKWAVMEMQERYELLAANGCRNIQDFNRRAQTGAPLQLPKRPEVAFEDRTYTAGILPYIVVVIDELADLMMTVQGEIETPLAMLAQKARAIGLHLILATQRPSVNVITGLIKANFPSRIAFRVASQVDSRTILDGIGAESLLGNGDMLFIPPGKSEPARLQGAYISMEDTERLMHWYGDRREAKKKEFESQGLIPEPTTELEPDILAQVREREKRDADGADDESAQSEDRDPLFLKAAEAIIHNQQGSTSLLQRKLQIGYGRAARIIDQLHAAGVLGPANGSKSREVLMGLEDAERMFGGQSD